LITAALAEPGGSPAPSAVCSSDSPSASPTTNGCGTYAWPDGTRYVGQFRGGYFDGHGTIAYADGSRYDGEFQESAPYGNGTYTTRDGDHFTGEVRQALPDMSKPRATAHYPFWRAMFGGQASVAMRVVISERGDVLIAQVIQPTDYPSFDQAAIDAVEQWKYLPASIDGHAIKSTAVIVVQFAQAQL
jgi:TonB family protein